MNLIGVAEKLSGPGLCVKEASSSVMVVFLDWEIMQTKKKKKKAD